MNPKKQLLPYAIVVLLAYIGFALPLPVLPVLFLRPEYHFFASDVEIATKIILLGIVLTAYPAGQLIGSPILGRLSDRWGRKRVILASLGGTVIGYLLAAIAIQIYSLPLLFLGLFLGGLCEGNTGIAQSAIADLAPKKERGRYFGWLNFFITAGFVIGPFLGGLFTDSSLFSGLTPATPFWVGGALTLLGMGYFALKANETLKGEQPTLLPFLLSIKALLKLPNIKLFYIANFFLSIGLYYFYRCVGVYLEQTFHFSAVTLGYFLAYDSLSFAVSLFFLVPYFEKKFSPTKNASLFSALFGLAMVVFVLPSSYHHLFWTFLLIGFPLAISLTYSGVIVSLCAEGNRQGEAMGLLVSIQMLAQVLTSFTGGFLSSYSPALPLLIGSSMCFVCALLLLLPKTAQKALEEEESTAEVSRENEVESE